MILKDKYQLTKELYDEAFRYAVLSRQFTSNRHDFHPGGLDNKQQKMLEGKLGEKGFKMFLAENRIFFQEDPTSHTERDEYDFLIFPDGKKLKIDVKTRTESYHTRTLEMVEQAQLHPKDLYVSARLYKETNEVKLLGWFSYQDMINTNIIENHGYLDNYVMYDKHLRSMQSLYELHLLSSKLPKCPF